MSRFNREYVDIKRKLVNIYEVERGLSNGLQVIKPEQKKDLKDAVEYIQSKIAEYTNTIQDIMTQEKGLLDGTGLRTLCAKEHIRKLEDLEAKVKLCNKMHNELIEKMKEQGF